MGASVTFAAIDLGSNTCRLSVKSLENGEWRTLQRYSSATRLGTELSKGESLDDCAVQRTIHAIGECKRRYEGCKPDYVRAVATEACRLAHDSAELQRRVKEEHGLELEVISPEEEAYLCLCGCLEYIGARKPYTLMFDIGGGSTELLLVEHDIKQKKLIIRQIISIPFGVVRLADAYGKHMHRVLRDIRQYVREHIERSFGRVFLKRIARNHKMQVIGCSGTATTAAGLVLGLTSYDRERVNGLRLPRDRLLELEEYLMDTDSYKRTPFITSNKANLVPPGLAIFLGICDACHVPSIQVVDQGVRDGIIVDTAIQHKLIQLPYQLLRPEVWGAGCSTDDAKKVG